MSIFFKCPNCGRPFDRPEDTIGETFTCDVCAAPVTVPAESERRPVHEMEFNQYKARMVVRILFWTFVAIIFGSIFVCISPFLLPKVNLNLRNEERIAAETQELLAQLRAESVISKRLPETPYPKLPPPGKFVAQPPLDAPTAWVQSKTGQGPGSRMQLRIYLPPGEHADKSLPCIVTPPATANVFLGVMVAPQDEFPEVQPYLDAGYAVIVYSIDGQLPQDAHQRPDHEFRVAFELARRRHFRACFGAANGRNAVEYALRNLPQVDPHQIYAAGQNAAGSIALLLAENEPRLAGCIAIAPLVDVEARYEQAAQVDPNIADLAFFSAEQSPLTHPEGIECPVFLFHQPLEDAPEFADTKNFAETIKQLGVDVTFVIGDPEEFKFFGGAKKAVQWLEERNPSVPKNVAPTPPADDE